MKENKLIRAVRALIIVLWCSFALGPIVWLGLTSFKPEYEAMSRPVVLFPNPPTLANYQLLLAPGNQFASGLFATKLPNSLIVAAGTTVSVLVLALLASYAISRYSFKGRRILFFGILGMQMLPAIASIVPLFVYFSNLHLIDNLATLVMVYTVVNLPFIVWVMKGFVDAIPVELEEAAQVDGASRLGAFFRVVVPLLLPGIGAAAVVAWISSWGEFAFAFFLTGPVAGTLPILAPSFVTEVGTVWGEMAAYAVIVVLPAIVVAIVAQRAFVSGLSLGAVKK